MEVVTLCAQHTTVLKNRDGRLQVLLCTDMAARGLDIPSTVLVVQVHFPAVDLYMRYDASIVYHSMHIQHSITEHR